MSSTNLNYSSEWNREVDKKDIALETSDKNDKKLRGLNKKGKSNLSGTTKKKGDKPLHHSKAVQMTESTQVRRHL